jgi:hypothetical protein
VATLSPLNIPCPACGQTVEVTVAATLGEPTQDGAVQVAVAATDESIRRAAALHAECLRAACEGGDE